MKRKIIHIDRHKCNGCGLCIDACHEGAIALVEGKAELVSDSYCDGLGDCLGECPTGAITIEEREAQPYDVKAVSRRIKQKAKASQDARSNGCPGMDTLTLMSESAEGKGNRPAGTGNSKSASALRQWPVQLQLVPTVAPYWDNADLLIAADCVAVSCGGFHTQLLEGKRLIIACPKLDDTSGYAAKLTEIFRDNAVRSVTVAHMEVPCCNGIVRLVETALAASGKEVPLTDIIVSIRGETRTCRTAEKQTATRQGEKK